MSARVRVRVRVRVRARARVRVSVRVRVRDTVSVSVRFRVRVRPSSCTLSAAGEELRMRSLRGLVTKCFFSLAPPLLLLSTLLCRC